MSGVGTGAWSLVVPHRPGWCRWCELEAYHELQAVLGRWPNVWFGAGPDATDGGYTTEFGLAATDARDAGAAALATFAGRLRSLPLATDPPERHAHVRVATWARGELTRLGTAAARAARDGVARELRSARRRFANLLDRRALRAAVREGLQRERGRRGA